MYVKSDLSTRSGKRVVTGTVFSEIQDEVGYVKFNGATLRLPDPINNQFDKTRLRFLLPG